MTAPGTPPADALREHIRPDGDLRLYAVIDGATAAELANRAWSLYVRKLESLFTGALDDNLKSVSPWVTRFDDNLFYADDWIEFWGCNPGILVTASGHPARVHSHLRSIFVVKDETGQEFFFRYYDPRVLRAYLPTCTGEEAREFFGPIKHVFAPDESGTHLVRYVRDPIGIRSETFDLGLGAHAGQDSEPAPSAGEVRS